MTPEEKEILIKDLNKRLPYGITIQYNRLSYESKKKK